MIAEHRAASVGQAADAGALFAEEPSDMPTLSTFVDWHKRWNGELGIWELDRELKVLRRTLLAVQDKIIKGEPVNVPLPQNAGELLSLVS